MTVLDTSALIRFLTNDIPSKAKKVKDILDSEKVYIPDVVFPELEYVLLGRTYNSSKKKLLEAFQYLIFNKNIKTSKEVKMALLIYKDNNLDMADCIIIAHATKNQLLSFDKKMLKVARKK